MTTAPSDTHIRDVAFGAYEERFQVTRFSDVESFSLDVTRDSPRQLPTSTTLVRTIDTTTWSTPSTDSSGITYIAHLGAMLILGTLLSPLTAFAFSDDPTGVAYNPFNKHLYFSDDAGTRAVYELDPGLLPNPPLRAG